MGAHGQTPEALKMHRLASVGVGGALFLLAPPPPAQPQCLTHQVFQGPSVASGRRGRWGPGLEQRGDLVLQLSELTLKLSRAVRRPSPSAFRAYTEAKQVLTLKRHLDKPAEEIASVFYSSEVTWSQPCAKDRQLLSQQKVARSSGHVGVSPIS